MTAHQNFTIYEGESKTIRIAVTDTEDGDPTPLTGATAITWRVSTGPDSETAIIEKTLADGEISLEDSVADDGVDDDRIDIVLDAGDTTGKGGNSYYHECRVVDAASLPYVVASGRMKVMQSNTG